MSRPKKNPDAVVEHYGYCHQCRALAVLGDGLCPDCWDEKPRRICCGQYVKIRQHFRHKTDYACKVCGKIYPVYNDRDKHMAYDMSVVSKVIEYILNKISYTKIVVRIEEEFGYHLSLATINYWKKKYLEGVKTCRSVLNT